MLDMNDPNRSHLEVFVGCSGWSHPSWKGRFYPSDLDTSDWLSYYSNIFDHVEIDSSFYRVPDVFMAKNWYNKTPPHFRFTAIFPQIITHHKKLLDAKYELEGFFASMSKLGEKLLCLLMQLPASMKVTEGLESLKRILPTLDPSFRYAVEVRDRSWFQDLAYDFFANNNICMVWNESTGIQTPAVVTTDFVYLRFIADRIMDYSDKNQDDNVIGMQYWANKVTQVRTEDAVSNKVKLAIVSANNSYSGFGPSTANSFRKMIGLQEVRWDDRNIVQRKISDYTNVQLEHAV
ncbi:MAG: DUF72 domain-containing protein [Nitrososphaeraceae archaeon]